MMCSLVVFFFSSRRRHTRFDCDWSSDVCSSDLIDETAYIDGYSFPRFFLTIFLPLIKAGVGVAAFFCFMFSWVELLLARTLTSVNAKPIVATMTRTVSASGMDWATLAAAGVLTIVPGAIVIWFVRHYIAKGFARSEERRVGKECRS